MTRMTEVRTAHTADLDPTALAAARALLDEAFDGDFSDHDWEHSLGGMHAMLWDGDELVGHASVVQRRLLLAGRAVRTGYVEAVAVAASHRRNGHGTRLMTEVERVIHGGYDLGALSTSDEAHDFYAARGWRLWRGPTFAVTPLGIARTEDEDGGVYVLPVSVTPDLSGEITCDWRDGDVW
ncbi:GNAT family N-acetyltransferase [Streptomyces millisiae]